MGAESQKQLLAHKAWTSLGSMARTVIPIPAILQLRRSSDKSVPQMVMPLWCAVLADRTIRDKRRSLVATDVVGAFALRTSSCYVSFAAAQWALRARNNCWPTRLGLAWAYGSHSNSNPGNLATAQVFRQVRTADGYAIVVRSFGRPDHPGQATISRRYRCRRRLCSAHQQLLRFVRSCTMGAESFKQLLVAHKAWTRLSSLADRSIRDKQRCRRYRCFRCRETHVISIGAPPINKPLNFCVGFG